MTRGVIVFWVLFLGLIGWDYSLRGHPRVEPPPIALGSGKTVNAGHCSGR